MSVIIDGSKDGDDEGCGVRPEVASKHGKCDWCEYHGIIAWTDGTHPPDGVTGGYLCAECAIEWCDPGEPEVFEVDEVDELVNTDKIGKA